TGTSPVTADGQAASTITILLKDANGNPVSGQTVTFSATDTGSTNVYVACTPTDAAGASTCGLKSTKAETKTLQLLSPVSKTGGTVTFVAGAASATTSSITGSSPVTADGVAASAITIVIKDADGNPISGQTVTFSATDTGSTNTYVPCSLTGTPGTYHCRLTSFECGTKAL